MTIDETIKEFTEWAKNDRDEVNYWLAQRNESDETNPFCAEYGGFARNAEASAERYEQLAAWLRELKELRNSVRGVNLTVADVQLVVSGDNCIVCGHDVRKDNVYYDVNGGTICESCMKTKCKCKNGR